MSHAEPDSFKYPPLEGYKYLGGIYYYIISGYIRQFIVFYNTSPDVRY